MVPQDVSFKDWMNVMVNLDKAEFENSLYRTYLLALSQMNLIRANYGIERELDRYYQRLLKKQKIKKIFEKVNQIEEISNSCDKLNWSISKN